MWPFEYFHLTDMFSVDCENTGNSAGVLQAPLDVPARLQVSDRQTEKQCRTYLITPAFRNFWPYFGGRKHFWIWFPKKAVNGEVMYCPDVTGSHAASFS